MYKQCGWWTYTECIVSITLLIFWLCVLCFVSQIENTTEPQFDLQQLKSDTYYSIYVVAMNEHGASLPSLVLLVHTPERDEIYNETVQGDLSLQNTSYYFSSLISSNIMDLLVLLLFG